MLIGLNPSASSPKLRPALILQQVMHDASCTKMKEVFLKTPPMLQTKSIRARLTFCQNGDSRVPLIGIVLSILLVQYRHWGCQAVMDAERVT